MRDFPTDTPEWARVLDARQEVRIGEIAEQVEAISKEVDELKDRVDDFERREGLCEFKVFGGHGISERLAGVERKADSLDGRIKTVETELHTTKAAVHGGWRALAWGAGALGSAAGLWSWIKRHL